MDSLQKGYAFFKLAWQAARIRPSLFSPTLYTMLFGLLLTLVLVSLIGLTAFRLGTNVPGLLLAGLLAAVLIFGLSAIASIFSVMTAVLFHQELAGEAVNFSSAWKSLRQNIGEVLILTLAAPAIALQHGWYQRQVAGSPPEQAWQEANYLVIPTLAVETLPLSNSLKRITGMVRSRLLRIGPELIGVSAFSRLAGIVLGLVGALFGLVLNNLLSGSNAAAGPRQVGALVGILVACLFILAAIALGTYATTVYHTSLYYWACQSDRARQDGRPANEGTAPPHLLAILLSSGQEG
jgi:hypothetical protein